MEIKKQDKKQVKALPVKTLSEQEMSSVSGGGIIVGFDGVVVGD